MKFKVELWSVVVSTRVVFKGPTAKFVVEGVLVFVMGVPSQWYHWKEAMPVAGDQRLEVT